MKESYISNKPVEIVSPMYPFWNRDAESLSPIVPTKPIDIDRIERFLHNLDSTDPNMQLTSMGTHIALLLGKTDHIVKEKQLIRTAECHGIVNLPITTHTGTILKLAQIVRRKLIGVGFDLLKLDGVVVDGSVITEVWYAPHDWKQHAEDQLHDAWKQQLHDAGLE